MKKFLILFLISLGLVILQQSIFSGISIFGAAIDIVFVYIVCFSIVRDEVESIGVALITGILRDSFFPGAFGINTVLYILIAFIIGFIQKRIYKDSVIVPVIFTFFSSIIKGIFYFIIYYMVSSIFSFSYINIVNILLECIYNSIVSLFLLRFVKKFDTLNILKKEWKF